ncbi:hypothetical protein PHAVU_007G117475 [Phaseolus vulgaris]
MIGTGTQEHLSVIVFILSCSLMINLPFQCLSFFLLLTRSSLFQIWVWC